MGYSDPFDHKYIVISCPAHLHMWTLYAFFFCRVSCLDFPLCTALGTPGGVQRPCGPVPVRHCERGHFALPSARLRPPPYAVDVDEARHGERLCLAAPAHATCPGCHLLMLQVSPRGTWRTQSLTPSFPFVCPGPSQIVEGQIAAYAGTAALESLLMKCVGRLD